MATKGVPKWYLGDRSQLKDQDDLPEYDGRYFDSEQEGLWYQESQARLAENQKWLDDFKEKTRIKQPDPLPFDPVNIGMPGEMELPLPKPRLRTISDTDSSLLGANNPINYDPNQIGMPMAQTLPRIGRTKTNVSDSDPTLIGSNPAVDKPRLDNSETQIKAVMPKGQINNNPYAGDISKGGSVIKPTWKEVAGKSIATGISQTIGTFLHQAESAGEIDQELSKNRLADAVSNGIGNAVLGGTGNAVVRGGMALANKYHDQLTQMEEGTDKISEQYQIDLTNATDTQKMVGDALASAPQFMLNFIPYIGQAAFFTSAMGGYSKEAEQEGANIWQQTGYGAVGGAIETATEKLPVEGISKTFLGKWIKLGSSKLVGKFGEAAIMLAGDYLTEAVQEAAADPLSGLAKKAIYKPDMPWTGEGGVLDFTQMKYDAQVGGLMGVMLGALGLPHGFKSNRMMERTLAEAKQLKPEMINLIAAQLKDDLASVQTPQQMETILQQSEQEYKTETETQQKYQAFNKMSDGKLRDLQYEIYNEMKTQKEMQTTKALATLKGGDKVGARNTQNAIDLQVITQILNERAGMQTGAAAAAEPVQPNAEAQTINNTTAGVPNMGQQTIDPLQEQVSVPNMGQQTMETVNTAAAEEKIPGLKVESETKIPKREIPNTQASQIDTTGAIAQPQLNEETSKGSLGTTEVESSPRASKEVLENNTVKSPKISVEDQLLYEKDQKTLNEIKTVMAKDGIDSNFELETQMTTQRRRLKKVAKSLGVEVVFYKGGEDVPSGFVNNKVKNTIFIKASNDHAEMVATAGHEFLHQVRKNYSDEFKGLLDFAKKNFTPEAREQYLSTFRNTPEIQERLRNNENELLEEMLADELGNNFLDKGFWKKVYSHSKELFDKLVTIAKSLVEKFDKRDKYDTYVDKKSSKSLTKQFEEVVGSIAKQVAEGSVDTEAGIVNADNETKYSARGVKTDNNMLQEYDQEDLTIMSLKEATDKGLFDKKSYEVIEAIRKAFPQAWKEHIDVMYSDQEFAVGEAEAKGTAYSKNDKLTSTTMYVKQKDKNNKLGKDAKNIIIMFKDSNALDFIHQYGDFLYNRVLTKKQKDVVSKAHESAGLPNKIYKHSFFGEMLEKYWLQGNDRIKGKKISKSLNDLLFDSVQSIKHIADRFYAMGDKNAISKELKPLINDIIGSGEEYGEKLKKIKTDLFYTDDEVIYKYLIPKEADTPDMERLVKLTKGKRWYYQGFSSNAKTGWSYDPSSNCPKKDDFIKYVLNYIAENNIDQDMLANDKFYMDLYDKAVDQGITVPCEYCYVEAARRLALKYHSEGAKATGVNFAQAKQLYSSRPYAHEILRFSAKDIAEMNKRGGLRIFSFSDYVRGTTADGGHTELVKAVLEDAAKRGLAIKVITKQTTFVEDFGHYGMNIQLSIDSDGQEFAGHDWTKNKKGGKKVSQGIPWDEAFKLSAEYENVVIRTLAKNIDEVKAFLDLKNPYNGKRAVSVITPYHGDTSTFPGYEDLTSGHKMWKEMMKEVGLKQENDNVDNDEYYASLCCAEGGKCFKEYKDGRKVQCATNCGVKRGNLTIPMANPSKSNRKINISINKTIDSSEVPTTENIIPPTSAEAIEIAAEHYDMDIKGKKPKNPKPKKKAKKTESQSKMDGDFISGSTEDDDMKYSARDKKKLPQLKGEYNPAETSLNQVPALFTKPKVFKPKGLNVDIGGGKFDKATEFMKDVYGAVNKIFDTFSRKYEFNKASLDYLLDKNIPTTTANNVLNVIKDRVDRLGVIAQSAAMVDKDGTSYFLIYQAGAKADKNAFNADGISDNGSMRGRGYKKTWQNVLTAKAYVSEIEEYYGEVTTNGNVITARKPLKEKLTQELLNHQGEQHRTEDESIVFDGTAGDHSLWDWYVKHEANTNKKSIDNADPTTTIDTLKKDAKAAKEAKAKAKLPKVKAKHTRETLYTHNKRKDGTYAESKIQRSELGVGKYIGQQYYVHKNYATDVIPKDIYDKALETFKASDQYYDFNTLRYDPRTDEVRFDESPDFDTAREPIPNKQTTVYKDGTISKTKTEKQIFHHKWQWVKDDYKGFDVDESYEWSKKWLSKLEEPANGHLHIWNEQLKKYNAEESKNTYSVRSKEFNDWFKDSKVVDKKGEPLIVYHGSPSGGFNTFDTNAAPIRARSGIQGSYFTSDQGQASNYRGRKGGKIYPVYLSLQNPLDITKDIAKYRKKGMSFAEAKAEALKKFDPSVHDGVIFKGNAYNSDEYVAVKPSQIKSAVDNNGDYDPNNDDIRYSVRSKRFKDWFRDSKVVDEDGNPAVVYHGTRAKDIFNIFDTEKNVDEPGTHFGTLGAANWFVQPMIKPWDDNDPGMQMPGDRIYPVFLSIQKPLETRDAYGDAESVYFHVRDIVNKGNLRNGEAWGDIISSYNVWRQQKNHDIYGGRYDIYTKPFMKSIVNYLKGLGYDGIKYVNNTEDQGSVSWIVFDPTQIKSSIGNSGEYASDNPDIRLSVRQRTKKRKFIDNSMLNALPIPEQIKEEYRKHPEWYEYEQITNQETLDWARAEIEDDYLGHFMDLSQQTSLTSEKDTALAIEIARKYILEGDFESAREWSLQVAKMGTATGRAIQYFSTLKRFTPEWTLQRMQKQIDENVTEKEKKKVIKDSKEVSDSLNDINEKAIEDVVEDLDGKTVEDVIEEAKENLSPEGKEKATEKAKKKNKKKPEAAPEEGSTENPSNVPTEEPTEESIKEPTKKPRKKPTKDSTKDSIKEETEEEEEEDPAPEMLANRIKTHMSDPKVREDDPLRMMVDTLYNVAKENLPQREKSKPRDPADFIIEAMKDPDYYKEVWNDAKAIVQEKLKDNPDALQQLGTYFDRYLTRPFAEKQMDKFVKNSLDELNIDLHEIIMGVYSRNETNNKIADVLIDKGLDPQSAYELEEYIAESVDKLTREAKERYLKQHYGERTKTEKKEQSAFEKIIELSNYGAFTNKKYRDLVAEKLGITVLTDEDVKELLRLAEEVQKYDEGTRERKEATARVVEFMESKVKKSMLNKIGTYQTLAMLLNPKTALRNVIGNVLFAGITHGKDYLRAGIDAAISNITHKRTAVRPSVKSKLAGLKKESKEVWLDFKHDVNTAERGTKLELSSGKTFQKGIFAQAERLARLILDDRPFKGAAYNNEIRSLKKVAELNGEEFNEIEAIDKAKLVAEYVTFTDKNAISDMVTGMKRLLNAKHPWGLGDILIKFAKTPANIFAREIDYSPYSIGKALVHAATASVSSKVEFNQEMFVDDLAKGFTGTAVIALGVYLAKMGALILGDDDDKDKRSLLSTLGVGQFKINVSALMRFIISRKPQKLEEGDHLASYDWAAPLSTGLTMGAAMANVNNEKAVMNTSLTIAYAFQKGTDTIFEMPFLQGIKTLESGETFSEGMVKVLMGIPQTFIPTISNQVRQMVDNTKRDTRGDNAREKILNPLLNRIPMLSKTLTAKVDTLGEDEEIFKDGLAGKNNPYNVMVNPSNMTKFKPSPGAKLVLDIFDQTNSTVHFPRVAPKYITFSVPDRSEKSGYRLERIDFTVEEYNEYQRQLGLRTMKKFNELAERKPPLTEETADAMQDILTEIQSDVKEKFLKSKGYWQRKDKNKIYYIK